ncbi:MAG TPA: hypothetical protein VHB20_13795 [Verrucomicrobiae bacterium]|jgi:hypothetical protein|nr:hypothetical protein [Verrucomicrobiae bacterium]
MKAWLMILLAVAPLGAIAGGRERGVASETAPALAAKCEQESDSSWRALAQSMETLKDARELSAVSNVFATAEASTNRLAHAIGVLDQFQGRVAAITNDIADASLTEIDKQSLRDYVDSDLRVLENAKQSIIIQRHAVAEFLTKEKPRWNAMIKVLTRLYPEDQTMALMRDKFIAGADDLRASIETAPAPHENTAAAEPAYQPPRNDDKTGVGLGDYSGLSGPSRHAVLLLSGGSRPEDLLSYIKQAGSFKLSTDQIITLKANGVPEKVILAMLDHDRALRRQQRSD